MRTWWLVALWAVSGCSLTHDFDAPFPATNVGDRCARFCAEAVDCFKTLTDAARIECNWGNQPADLAMFEGYCRVDCAAQPGTVELECDNGNGVYADFWERNTPTAFSRLCEDNEALCDAACELDGLNTPLAEWAGKPLYRVPDECKAACRTVELDRWACVGEQQARTMRNDINDFAAHPERCE
ncbi:MAG: hypothetical protein KC613_09575 [Myxococcales bacterium]|nr:hypothetical protein [Myxococcales bacterium]MCB9525376.1 hypothetical protein [Myxococcales bacterium]